MSDIDVALRELGLTWDELDPLSHEEKEWIWFWENYEWDALIRLHNEHGLGTSDEMEMVRRYKDRGSTRTP